MKSQIAVSNSIKPIHSKIVNKIPNEACSKRFRFIELNIMLASIHSLLKGLIQRSNASNSSPMLKVEETHSNINLKLKIKIKRIPIEARTTGGRLESGTVGHCC
jgi:hypothetical protein